MTIQLVGVDLDGTLLDPSHTIRPRVRDAVIAMNAAGVRACLVTGRMYRSALPFARELHLDAPIVCYQGAAIVDPSSDEVLYDVPLANATALEYVAYAKQRNLHVQLYANDRYYCEERNHFSDLYAAVAGIEPVVVPSLERQFETSDATKAVIVADAPLATALVADLQERFAGKAYVTRSIAEFVEMMNPNVDKGRAFEVVAQRLGIALAETLAIGDAWNDAPLLRVAGFPVAMGSAPPELRALARAVVADNAHDGVAEAIERFVLA